ncbi:lachesin [Halyomorpha halys]|uniref:lachesin n=1 Tax=Halyomorpha halys TaxID=286706 RepID=UPI0006D4E51B
MFLTALLLLAFVPGQMSRRSPNGIPFLFEDFNLVSDSVLPRFAEPIQNVTVTIGKDALMACVVENLRNYKVAWVRVDTQTILSIHHHVITQNPRVSLSYNDHRSWYLHISNVQEIDRGWYMCQVNTDPMRSRAGYLQVVVPPRIVGGDSTKELVVRESTDMRLECHAEGYPEPYVMWRREDGKDMNYNGDIVNVVDGEILHINRVSRLHMGTYLCIASNGVPPSISRRVSLKVQFPPMLSIPNQLEGAYIGQDVTLGCQTEAFPSSINYWTTDNGDMIVSGEKYETSSSDDGYSRYMTLKIRNVTSRDFGSYQCVAKNSLGETDGVIKLEEIPSPLARTTVPTFIAVDKSRNKMKQERYSKQYEEYHRDNKVFVTESQLDAISTSPKPALNNSPNLKSSVAATFCLFLLYLS